MANYLSLSPKEGGREICAGVPTHSRLPLVRHETFIADVTTESQQEVGSPRGTDTHRHTLTHTHALEPTIPNNRCFVLLKFCLYLQPLKMDRAHTHVQARTHICTHTHTHIESTGLIYGWCTVLTPSTPGAVRRYSSA